MVARKALCIILILLFSLCLFATGALAGVCLWGKNCMRCGARGLQYEIKANGLEFNGSCPADKQANCDLGKVRNSDTVDSSVHKDREKSYDGADIIIVFADFLPDNHLFDNTALTLYDRAANQTPPIYQHNHSFLC